MNVAKEQLKNALKVVETIQQNSGIIYATITCEGGITQK